MCEAEQLEFSNNTSIDLKKSLENIISSVCQSQQVDEKYVHCKDINGGYSVWIREPIELKDTYRSFSICIKGKKEPKYAVEIIYKKIHNIPIPKGTQFDNVQQSTIFFPMDHPELLSYLHDILDYSLKNFEPSNKIGCCGKYEQCSNAKKCLHDNTFYARACYYRKNLESGKIFYGENRNVE